MIRASVLAVALVLAPIEWVAATSLPWTQFSQLAKDVTDAGNGLCATGPIIAAEAQRGAQTFSFFANEQRWVVAQLVDGRPTHIWLGRVDGDVMVVVRDEPYDPARHQGPCEDWLDRPST